MSKKNSKPKFRKFTDEDWGIYFGAEGDEPLVAYLPITIDGILWDYGSIVIDDNGLSIQVASQDDAAGWEQRTFTLDTMFPDYDLCVEIAQSLDYTKLSSKMLRMINFADLSDE